MSCGQLKLTNVQPHIGYDNLANILEANLKMYYDWALLCLGGWTEVQIPTAGAYGGDYSQLVRVDDPAYNPGQVWQAIRKDFVWEQNIDYVDTTGGIINPMSVGTPRVNNAFTTQSYSVNYPQGQVIFDNPQPINATVELAYSYRYVQVYRADDAPWWKELQFNSHRTDSEQFQQVSSGVWSLLGQHRVQLPAVVIESVPLGSSRGYELGSSSKYASRDILFHIFAENRHDRNNLMDIFNLQSDRVIPLFDTNRVVENNAFPLDYRGERINSNGYPELSSPTGYEYRKCFMNNSLLSSIQQIHPNLYNAVVKTTMEVIV